MYPFFNFKCFLFPNYLYFFRIYSQPHAYLNNKPKVFYLFLFELVFINI